MIADPEASNRQLREALATTASVAEKALERLQRAETVIDNALSVASSLTDSQNPSFQVIGRDLKAVLDVYRKTVQ